MYGSGVGDLNVYLRSGNRDRKVWGLSGDAGNNWYLAQAAVASSTPFKVTKDFEVQRVVKLELQELGQVISNPV